MREEPCCECRPVLVRQKLTFILHICFSSQSLTRVNQSKISIPINTTLKMADTEPKVVEEVPAAMEEEAQDPKVRRKRKLWNSCK